MGRRITDAILVNPLLSRAYGAIQSSSLSRKKIPTFAKEFGVDMTLFEDPGFRSFNEFFIRKFRPGVRHFESAQRLMPAPAEARYFAWESHSQRQHFPIKNLELNPAAILGRPCHEFEGGPVLVARLCPVDYHRFHYPDSGETVGQWHVKGVLHSVNPEALRAKSRIFAINERQVSLLKTEAFGLLAYVEVGALCVGRIVQSHKGKFFRRGDEKGYFLFGGSTVILFGELGRWKPSADLLQHTARGMETLVELGTPVAEAL
ncbi:MAG: phosphatidylserine decarboxylase [Bdellovibrionales bacterium]|nr:phosphatidylserine decarboxylase [Bdellovibrionales bacterium]